MNLFRILAYTRTIGTLLTYLGCFLRGDYLFPRNSQQSGLPDIEQDPLAQGAEDEKPENSQIEMQFGQGESFDELIETCRAHGTPKVSTD